MVHRRLVYIYLLNVPSLSSRYFNKIKRTSRLGRLLALSLEILWYQIWCSTMTRNWDMTNLPHTLPNEMSAILVFGGHLENGRIWSGQESFLNAWDVIKIWWKFHTCIIKWSIFSVSRSTNTSTTSKQYSWKPSQQLKGAYTKPIPHTNKKLSSLIAL